MYKDGNTRVKSMKSILFLVIIMSITGCLSMSPPDSGISTATTPKQIKKQIKYNWSQVDKEMTKKEVVHILGNPTDIQNSDDIEIWKYEYDISRTYGSVSFRRNEDHVWFFSKPLF